MRFSVLSTVASLAIVTPTLAQTPPGFSPATTKTFTVKFGNTAVTAGNAIKLQDTAVAPSVDFGDVSGGSAHVVAMLDLDAPMGDADRSYSPLLHWMASIPSGDKSSATAKDVAPYAGPQPPVGYGPHRYVLLLLTDPSAEFHLPSGFENQTYADVTSRLQFPLEKFLAAGNFQVTAANWFTTENITTTPTNSTGPSNSSSPSTSAPVTAGASGLQTSLMGAVLALMSLQIFNL
ncbi:unnamed protein product [Clonostachys byssicola]|uniref:PEBP-like protein n=1 Tax=Clonostachys byssicola TaxID=160290 RepID=A0A9N9UDB9_9HYPO|nr:unnamed protein product [Clonostachys byssicola]